MVVAVVGVIAVVAALLGGVWWLRQRPAQPTDRPTDLAVVAGVALSSVEDAGVREAVATADTDGDGVLSEAEARVVSTLEIQRPVVVRSLARLVPQLTELRITGGTTKELDVSDLTGLTRLDVASEPVASLDLSANTKLTELSVHDATVLTGLEQVPGIWQTWLLEEVSSDVDGQGLRPVSTVKRDESGRVIALVGTNGPANEYTYDEAGHLVGTSLWTFGYDEAGRLASAEASGGGRSVRFSYDAQGNPVQVWDADQLTATYEYDADGRLAQAYGMEWRITWSYGEAGELTSWKEVFEGGTTESVYDYDEQGRVVRVRQSNDYLSGPVPDTERTMTYDDAGRPVQMSVDGVAALDLEYDDFGNISAATQLTGTYPGRYELSWKRYVGPADQAPAQGLVLEIGFPALLATQDPTTVVQVGGLDWPVSLDGPQKPGMSRGVLTQFLW